MRASAETEEELVSRRRISRRAAADDAPDVLGIAWYSREDWPKLKSVAADPEVIEETYDEWLQVVERTRRQLRAQGLEPERVEVNIDELVEWCREAQRPVDAFARAEFTAELLRRRDNAG